RMALLPGADALPPLVQARAVGLQRAVLGRELGQDVLRVADDRYVRRHVLGDLGRVDVDVDELRPRRELAELAGDAVVEARADGDDEGGLVHRVVGRAGAGYTA